MEGNSNAEQDCIATVITRQSNGFQRMLIAILMMFTLTNFSTIIHEEVAGNKLFKNKVNRVNFDTDISAPLSDYQFRRIYRMGKDTFNNLHQFLLPQLTKI